MKKIILLVGLALVGVISWYIWETRNKPRNELAATITPAVSKHSTDFNNSFNTVLNHYYALSEAFVNWDEAGINAHSTSLSTSVDSLNFEDIKNETAVIETANDYKNKLKRNAEQIAASGDVTEKRRIFHTMSSNLYDLLRSVQYDAGTIYMQNCPMAFNDTEDGNWLSRTPDIRNPYLGLHHPKYRSGMLECGETKDSLGYIK
jgi:hypothetical protein